MTERLFRVTVRGFFDQLTPAQKAELLEQAQHHDPLHARFTEEGHLAYEIEARTAFTFRFLDSGKEEADITRATERAQVRAAEWLSQRGYAFKNLRAQAEDLSQAPIGRSQRRRAS
ncbi:DUF6204 family protein [Streptomyces antibioticus]|uniref:DUF6204 family protein n=1 Tax=Streptomyces antibioticus TaxID=1890 RepID=UPI0033E894E6